MYYKMKPRPKRQNTLTSTEMLYFGEDKDDTVVHAKCHFVSALLASPCPTPDCCALGPRCGLCRRAFPRLVGTVAVCCSVTLWVVSGGSERLVP